MQDGERIVVLVEQDGFGDLELEAARREVRRRERTEDDA